MRPSLPSLHISIINDPPDDGDSSGFVTTDKRLPLPLHSEHAHSPLHTHTAARGFRQRRCLFLVLVALVVVVGLIGNRHWDKATALPQWVQKPAPTDPLAALRAWGVETPTSVELLGHLSAWPPKPHGAEPLSSLGSPADNAYDLGPTTLSAYTDQLRGYISSFPEAYGPVLRAGLDTYLSHAGGEAWDANKTIWQTDKNGETRGTGAVRTWRGSSAADEGWKWESLDDNGAWEWAAAELQGSAVGNLWAALPTGILRADILRYLDLLLYGGIYSDTDTRLLKAPSRWGAGSVAFKNGEGWALSAQRGRLAAGEDPEEVLGKPSVVVGIEADVGERVDWAQWWSRPIQIVQWTMASARAHPIALQAILHIQHKTAQAAAWAAERAREIDSLEDRLRDEKSAAADAASGSSSDGGSEHAAKAAEKVSKTEAELERLRRPVVVNSPSEGGPIGVMEWTGPGVWTDATLAYLRVKYGVQWVDLRGMTKPTRIGDVLVLPVTGFSPGVGHFGAGSKDDPLAMVWHQFRGSWRLESGEGDPHPMMFPGPGD